MILNKIQIIRILFIDLMVKVFIVSKNLDLNRTNRITVKALLLFVIHQNKNIQTIKLMQSSYTQMD